MKKYICIATIIFSGLLIWQIGFVSFLFIGLIGLVLWFVIYSRLRKNRIVICANCRTKMSYQRFVQGGGCIRCGTDLYEETGNYARR